MSHDRGVRAREYEGLDGIERRPLTGWSRSAGWAVVVVAASIGSAYALDALGLRSLARAALIPVYPVLLVLLRIAGGFHSASGDWRVMALTALVSVGLWWGIFEGWRRLRVRNRP